MPKGPGEISFNDRVNRKFSAKKEDVPSLAFFEWNYEPTKIIGTSAVVPTRKVEGDYEVETTRFANGAFVRLPCSLGEGKLSELGNCQDAAALIIKDGILTDFALADGVSGSANGKLAAERAVALGAEALQSQQGGWSEASMKKKISDVEKEMQNFDIEEIRLKWAQNIISKKHNTFLQEILLENVGYAISTSGDLVRLKQRKMALGNTTLALGHIEGNDLHLVYAADGGYIVVNPANLKAYGGEHENAPPQLRLEGGTIREDDIDYKKIGLVTGDVVMVFTDGLYHGNGTPKDIGEKVVDYLKKGQNLGQIIKTLIANTQGTDDNSLLAFTYKG